jgi:hypothetical protein
MKQQQRPSADKDRGHVLNERLTPPEARQVERESDASKGGEARTSASGIRQSSLPVPR